MPMYPVIPFSIIYISLSRNVRYIKQGRYLHLLDGPLPAMVLGVCMQSAVAHRGGLQPAWITLRNLPDSFPSSTCLAVWGSQPCVALCTVLPLPAERLSTFSWISHVRCTQARLALVGVSASWHGGCGAAWRWTSGCAGLCGVTTPRRHNRGRRGTSPGSA